MHNTFAPSYSHRTNPVTAHRSRLSTALRNTVAELRAFPAAVDRERRILALREELAALDPAQVALLREALEQPSASMRSAPASTLLIDRGGC